MKVVDACNTDVNSELVLPTHSRYTSWDIKTMTTVHLLILQQEAAVSESDSTNV